MVTDELRGQSGQKGNQGSVQKLRLPRPDLAWEREDMAFPTAGAVQQKASTAQGGGPQKGGVGVSEKY